MLGAVNYDKLPFVDPGREYTAYFAEAGGLTDDAAVQVSGFKVGQVKSIELDGPQVLVTFTVDKDIRLGDRTEAAIKTKGLLGNQDPGGHRARRRPAGRHHSDSTAPRRPTSSPTPSVTWRPRSVA